MIESRQGGALVTGSGRGIGRAIAERLASLGFDVGVLARTKAEVEATAETIRAEGGRALPLVVDVLDEYGLARKLRDFLTWAGGCRVLVCAAGQFWGIGPVGEADPEAWWMDVETALHGTQLAIHNLLPALTASARGSISVLVGPGSASALANGSGYGMAQAALVRLVESVAIEQKASGIGVYAVWPGIVPTALMNELLDSAEGRRWLPEFTETFAEGKEVGPEVAAEMVAWLALVRPLGLSGRYIAAPSTPEILETRLGRIEADDLGRLRLR